MSQTPEITCECAAALVAGNQMSGPDWCKAIDAFDLIRHECTPEVLAVTDSIRGRIVEPEDLAQLFKGAK